MVSFKFWLSVGWDAILVSQRYTISDSRGCGGKLDLAEVMWRKSSRSSDQGDMRIELTAVADAIAIRDSKAPNGPTPTLSRRQFSRLADALKNT